VDINPIPLYFNDEMSPGRMGQFDHRVPQRREGTVVRRIPADEIILLDVGAQYIAPLHDGAPVPTVDGDAE